MAVLLRLHQIRSHSNEINDRLSPRNRPGYHGLLQRGLVPTQARYFSYMRNYCASRREDGQRAGIRSYLDWTTVDMTQRIGFSDPSELVSDFGSTLAMTQWLSPDELQVSQGSLLSELLLHARKTTRFYKHRLEFDLRSATGIQKMWSQIPIVTRRVAVENRFELTSRKTPRKTGSVRQGQTSGSTGAPFAFKTSAISELVGTALTERMLEWWGIDGAKSIARIAYDARQVAPPPAGRTTYGWHSRYPRAAQHFISSDADVETHLHWLVTHPAAYLRTYSSLLKELARTAQERGIALKFDRLLSFGAVLDDETRELCRSAFSAEIADTYGTQETGHIAAQCRECGEYHVSAEAVVVEVLRSDGSQASSGEIGRVIVTPLYNYAMPLIRYELGDLAEVGSARPTCGRGLPTLRRILGRTRNMFRFRDGTTIWPNAGAFRLGQFIALKQFQIVQIDFDQIEIKYVPLAIARPIDVAALTRQVRWALRQPVHVALRSVDDIARSSGGKYEECISLVSPS